MTKSFIVYYMESERKFFDNTKKDNIKNMKCELYHCTQAVFAEQQKFVM